MEEGYNMNEQENKLEINEEHTDQKLVLTEDKPQQNVEIHVTGFTLFAKTL
jgi:hypothetical protein